ncbi:GNAT family N-acetyltransferase [Paenarthrobacter sp. DKR-5]|uniref:GNAT family N-acetyltransferase n=1 Tax=Paenarthrobacter sp. DKR-5 TaxID=2835535 RepID=UPI001BDC9965|nr:GNAT family N-acetyltransferase [Paenarthrobacter sp. DKR-5]MBT1001487.1 GNAT family N-acetyltransferase [Paenarthrobacter sp. DKR-5]
MDQGSVPRLEIVLETERLLLRPWRVSDAATRRKLWSERDPRVLPHRRISPDGHPTLEDIEEWIRRGDRDLSPGLLAAEQKSSGEVIGYCGLIPNGYGQEGEPELAFEFLRKVWRQGFATEASWAVLERAQASGYRCLWATVRDWNTASRRVLAKLGFVETGQVVPDEVHGDSLFTRRKL